jgi:multiple sugar transport system permease protein
MAAILERPARARQRGRAGRGGRRGPRARSDRRAAVVFLAPSVLHFVVFTAGALIASLVMSTWKWDIVTSHTNVGASNYTALLSDPGFWNSLGVTLMYCAITIPGGLAVGLAISLMLNTKLRGVRVLRSAYFLPYIAPIAAVALLWRWMYNTDYGLLNWFLSLVVPGNVNIDWLGQPRLSLVAVALMDIWKNLGWSVTMFTAGLLAIPAHYYEAAALDGASPWQRFRHITWPLLTPTTFFLLVMAVIGSFQVFDSIYLMLGDTPSTAATTYNFYLWEQGFRYYNMGYASALSWVLFAIIGALTFLQFRFLNKRVNYELG